MCMRVLSCLAVLALMALSGPARAETAPSQSEMVTTEPSAVEPNIAEPNIAEPDDPPDHVEKGPPVPQVKDPSSPNSPDDLTFPAEDGGCGATGTSGVQPWWVLLAAPLLFSRRKRAQPPE